MSQTEYTQLTLEELQADNDISDEDFNQSVKGNLQLAEEEPRANGSNLPTFLSWKGQEEKVLFFPKKDSQGNVNAGKPKYKAYLKDIPDKNKNITHEKFEDFENDEKFNQYRKEGDKPKLRYYVEVVELTPQGSKRWTWDMAKTKYDLIFREYLTPEQRFLKIKPGKEAKDAPIVKYPSNAELKALLPAKSK